VDAPTFHLKTYGCQMNVSDTAVVRSILSGAGFVESASEEDADVSLTNTCAIRDNAEAKVWQRLRTLRALERKRKWKPQTFMGKQHRAQQKAKSPNAQPNAEPSGAPPPPPRPSTDGDQVVAVLGCMAERLKTDLFTDDGPTVDVVVGPDAYRSLPALLSKALAKNNKSLPLSQRSRGCDTELSFTETYAEISPERGENERTAAFISVMRGCNNMCSYCVVPFTRGRERSRDLPSIVREAREAVASGVREITLLGQNVNSYHDKSEEALAARPAADYETSQGEFKNMYNLRGGGGHYFADLVEAVADIDPEVRVRFTSPHPKDFPDSLLHLVRDRPNVCNQLHLPAQSGSTKVLADMRRGYSKDSYLSLIEHVRATIPGVNISSDFIAGFCGESEEDHRDTLDLMARVEFDQAFM
jgi:MiaB/RimO family radical SAM methylthiotransferase